MKQLFIALLCAALLLSGCAAPPQDESKRAAPSNDAQASVAEANAAIELEDFGSSATLQLVEDAVLSSIEESLASDDFAVDSVVASYVSSDFLEELDYNSKENIYFGYKLSELDAQFEGTRYVFGVDAQGKTEVREFEAYDDSYDIALKNIAVGTGVILVAVVVSVISGGVALPAAAAVSTTFAFAANAGTASALSGGAIGAITSGTISAMSGSNTADVLKSAALGGSESFKWGAITGVVAGGAAKALVPARSVARSIPTARESEAKALAHFGGSDQKSYLGGFEVPYATPGSTRPDISRIHKGMLEAIEVKNYDLEKNLPQLLSELKRQVVQRNLDLPTGSTQRIALDVARRGYTKKFKKEVSKKISSALEDIYPKIQIEFLDR